MTPPTTPVVVPTAAPTVAPAATAVPRPQPVNSNLTYRYSRGSQGTKLTSLVLAAIPRGATVEVRCSGKGCPRTTWVKRDAPPRLVLSVFRNRHSGSGPRSRCARSRPA